MAASPERKRIDDILIRDDPKPAIFIARKLFSDFFALAHKKIDSVLIQDNKGKSIFEPLQRNQDLAYDKILDALNPVSEYCLPSLLEILISWYHHQLDVDEHLQRKTLLNLSDSQKQQQQSCEVDCSSPCLNDTLNSCSSSTIRSPTPSAADTSSNQLSITSTLPLEYQSPSLTITGDLLSSTANTSTSTATNASSNSLTEDSTNTVNRLELAKTRKLLIEYTFCQALIEIFNQLGLHPGHEDLIEHIEDIAFEHFRHGDSSDLSADDVKNINQLADKYSEVIGVLARTRFKSVRRRFMTELNELKLKEATPFNIQCIVTMLSGMKYFRVKMAPIEELEASFQFLQELADYFLEVRHKSIKQALAALFVEILIPLSSIVKNEVKIPCLKNFVDTLWAQTLDMCTRKKHSVTLLPLVTCLLCVSQRTFFLTNWSSFLNMCLSNLKNRDQKICRVALESLYRLVWIYMIRVKCESNNVTQVRLQSIVDALFPRGSRTVIPRDAPLVMFVHIIQFIAQERLDFAMRHIIFDLLSVDRPFKVILAPERMSIALQAFLVIADSLQYKEGDPPLPRTLGIANLLENSNTNNNINGNINHNTTDKRKNHKMLNDETTKSIGLYPYYSHIQKSFNDILKALDNQYGRPLLLTATHNNNKEPDDMITGERKPKIDLFKICLAAIPRIMPEGMSKGDLVDLLSRMTVHVDEEIRKLAFEGLQILVTDFADWRLDTIEGFTSFLVNQIDDSLRHLVDNALRMLLQLLLTWKGTITSNSSSNLGHDSARASTVSIQTGYETIPSRHGGTGGQIAARKSRALTEMRLIQSELSNIRFDRLISVMQKVEGAALVMLCSCHQPARRFAAHLLRESRTILKCYASWTCMEQFGFRTPDDADEEDLSASLKGSLSADNLSRITATSVSNPVHSSVTSMNTQANLSTSISKMCISTTLAYANQQQQQQLNPQQQSLNQHQHDPYDSDIENNQVECHQTDYSSLLVFWLAVIMMESSVEQEYAVALRLLKQILPELPIEQQSFVEEVERSLIQMKWEHFPGIHALVLKGCSSALTYDTSIALLDQLTPILKHPICSGISSATTVAVNPNKADNIFPFHFIALLTHLLSNYDDPGSFSLNIARRIAIWCDENSQKLENLSAVMSLYSRRSFSKDSFQWTKCVVKYIYDANPQVLVQVIPLLVDMLEGGPEPIQCLIAPILYCVFNYVDINSQQTASSAITVDLMRVYSRYLESGTQWKDAVQIFKLIISRSSYLASNSASQSVVGRELPGRTMDFTIDIESIPIIGVRSSIADSSGVVGVGDRSASNNA